MITLGGLHTEMAAFRTFGDILDVSEWTDALAQADIATAGTCEGFLRADHLTKTRRAHQLTAAALYQLQQKVYLRSKEMENNGDGVPGNWPAFLRNSDNKQELFWFQSQKYADYETDGNKTI